MGDFAIDPQGGFIGGFLARKAFDQDYRMKEIEAQTAQEDLKTKQMANLAQENVDQALKAAGSDIFDKPPEEALAELAKIVGPANPVAAGELMVKSSQIAENKATTEKANYERTLEMADAVSGLLTGVDDNESLQMAAAKAGMLGLDPLGVLRTVATYSEQMGYKPEIIEALRQEMLTSKERAELAKVEAETELARQRTETERVRATVLIPAQAENNRAAAANHKKAGGGSTKLEASYRGVAAQMIGETYDMTMDQEALGVLSNKVYERAMDLRAQSPGIKGNRALQLAFQELQRNKEFAGYPKRVAEPGTKMAPLEIPFKGKEIDKESLEPNMVYEGIGRLKGQQFIWNGTGFEPLLPTGSDLGDYEGYELELEEELE